MLLGSVGFGAGLEQSNCGGVAASGAEVECLAYAKGRMAPCAPIRYEVRPRILECDGPAARATDLSATLGR
jgi:hypothetical protein